MAMKPRCPKGMGVVLECPVAIVFALDDATIAQFPARRNEKSTGFFVSPPASSSRTSASSR
jgi:hypothetical protein